MFGFLNYDLSRFGSSTFVSFSGVNLKTAAGFIRNGAADIGVDSSLVNQNLLNANKLDGLIQRAAAFVAEVQKGREV